METPIDQQPRPVGKPSMLGIILEPTKQFERIRENPRVALPLILLLVAFGLVGTWTGFLSADSPTTGSEVPVWLTVGMAAIVMALGVGVALLLTSLFHWLLTLLFRGEASYKQIFSLNTHLYILVLLSMIVTYTVASLTDVDPLQPVAPTSLAAVIDAKGFIGGILSGIEVFALWQLVLTAMGLSVIARISRGKAWTAALIIFVAGLLIAGATGAMTEFTQQMQGMNGG
ncbi:Yip1 family protein [Salinithrix halophila]|uniref:Yip1 family protein n=1 Tax=Salinithrix halophila TaxID=1485204 RepID=A0ABV8JCK2_9BACL